MSDLVDDLKGILEKRFLNVDFEVRFRRTRTISWFVVSWDTPLPFPGDVYEITCKFQGRGRYVTLIREGRVE